MTVESLAENRQPRLGEPQPGLAILGLRACARLALLRVCFDYHRNMLRVKLLESGARLPLVAHPSEDLGYDLFALDAITLEPHATMRVRTGIAVEARHPETGAPLGLLVRDRSSMAARGIATTGGVIDAGYRGEILVLMTNLGKTAVDLKAGEKIAQMIPVPVLTGLVQEVETLEDSARAAKGFGSSGR
jgi:dUTP pyrophosphatase